MLQTPLPFCYIPLGSFFFYFVGIKPKRILGSKGSSLRWGHADIEKSDGW